MSEKQNEQLQFHGVAAEDEPDGQAAEQGQGRGQPQRLRPALLGNRAVLPEPGVHRARTAGAAALDGRRHRQQVGRPLRRPGQKLQEGNQTAQHAALHQNHRLEGWNEKFDLFGLKEN